MKGNRTVFIVVRTVHPSIRGDKFWSTSHKKKKQLKRKRLQKKYTIKVVLKHYGDIDVKELNVIPQRINDDWLTAGSTWRRNNRNVFTVSSSNSALLVQNSEYCPSCAIELLKINNSGSSIGGCTHSKIPQRSIPKRPRTAISRVEWSRAVPYNPTVSYTTAMSNYCSKTLKIKNLEESSRHVGTMTTDLLQRAPQIELSSSLSKFGLQAFLCTSEVTHRPLNLEKLARNSSTLSPSLAPDLLKMEKKFKTLCGELLFELCKLTAKNVVTQKETSLEVQNVLEDSVPSQGSNANNESSPLTKSDTAIFMKHWPKSFQNFNKSHLNFIELCKPNFRVKTTKSNTKSIHFRPVPVTKKSFPLRAPVRTKDLLSQNKLIKNNRVSSSVLSFVSAEDKVPTGASESNLIEDVSPVNAYHPPRFQTPIGAFTKKAPHLDHLLPKSDRFLGNATHSNKPHPTKGSRKPSKTKNRSARQSNLRPKTDFHHVKPSSTALSERRGHFGSWPKTVKAAVETSRRNKPRSSVQRHQNEKHPQHGSALAKPNESVAKLRIEHHHPSEGSVPMFHYFKHLVDPKNAKKKSKKVKVPKVKKKIVRTELSEGFFSCLLPRVFK